MPSATCAALTEAGKTLAPRLQKLDIENAPVSDYTKRYYRDYLRKLDYALKSIIHLLEEGVKQTGKAIKEITLADHGGGIGMISFLAAEAGFRNVIYTDIFEPASKDAETLARLLGVKIRYFHVGDLPSLSEDLKREKLDIDLLVSRNVIEHIYDLDGFMKGLSLLPGNEKLSVAFSTTANWQNPLTVLYTERIQKKADRIGQKGKWEKATDRGIPFLEVRRKIIKENFAQLKEEEVELIARNTRGYIEEDIIDLTSRYTVSGDIPRPSPGYNTCDPLTGNRTEHLVPADFYRSLFEKHGYTFELTPGLYNTKYKTAALNLITPLVNRMIKMNRNLGVYLAPFIVMAGRRRK